MEARCIKAALLAAALLSCGANWRSENFIVVQASSDELAKEVASQAEAYRRELAIQWLGRELPPWRSPCPIVAFAGPREPSRGKTTFNVHPGGGVPTGWNMEIFGSRERLLDSVLPHEVLHTVFASHFGCPLPRWADEGACTTVEHHSERSKQEHNLIHYLKHDRGIAFNKMFAMREYPRDMLPLYAQGYSLTRYLIAKGGERRFVQFIGDGMALRSWTQAVQKHYGHESLAQLQTTWLAWVKQGSPPLSPHAEPTPQQLADSDPRAISAQIGRLRGGASPADNLIDHSPQPPSTFAHQQQPTAAAEVARPSQSGWYKKQRAEGTNTTAVPLAPKLHSAPTVRGQQPDDVFPPPEHQGSTDGKLVPLPKRARPLPQVASAESIASPKVLLQWRRGKDQPWAGMAMADEPAAKVALRSEPRPSDRPLDLRPEYFDAPLGTAGTVWR